jgi:hypothetical protein
MITVPKAAHGQALGIHFSDAWDVSCQGELTESVLILVQNPDFSWCQGIDEIRRMRGDQYLRPARLFSKRFELGREVTTSK